MNADPGPGHERRAALLAELGAEGAIRDELLAYLENPYSQLLDAAVTLPLAEDVTLEDSSADPQASAVESTGVADVARDIADSDNWTANNTTVFVQDGHVFDVQRVCVP